ncbi:MAG: SDR family oxidoreductase [Myxococcota bacterium]|nr:SDR family oxidoreductase [Myxococcota bacterium]MDW8361263.1 SDR family oxidoreductase [Myxococcales bacterium]
MARWRLDGTTVLITGASSGIGEALARQLASRAEALVLVARRVHRLEALAQELCAKRPELRVHVLPADLADRGSTDAMLEALERRVGAVDVLVNNAGFGDFGLFERCDWSKVERMIALNATAVAYLTRRLLPAMVARGRGGLLFVSSGFGLQWLPGFAAYIGTKHFVTGFAEALAAELRPAGIRVTQICPGPVDTEFESHVGNFTGRRPPRALVISAERCARIAIRALERGRPLVVPGLAMRLLLALGALTPRAVLRLLYAPLARWLRRAQPVEP